MLKKKNFMAEQVFKIESKSGNKILINSDGSLLLFNNKK